MAGIPKPVVTICVLTYGAYPRLARRCLGSILKHTRRELYRLVVGANAVSRETREYLRRLEAKGVIDTLHLSRRNLSKCPMMQRMIQGITTEFICWFDDDSYLTEPDAVESYLKAARASPPTTVLWGQEYACYSTKAFTRIKDPVRFVREAAWYRGLTPPYWEPGGKGEFDFEGRGCGDGRWRFITGGFWLMRMKAMRRIGWPDPRLNRVGDDVFMSEAIRQQGWTYQNVASKGVAISKERRRGPLHL